MQILRGSVKQLGRGVWLLPIIYMAWISFLSHLPSEKDKGVLLFGFQIKLDYSDLLHVPLYGILALLWKLVLECRGFGDRTTLPVIALSVGFGVIDELHQGFVPGRDPSLSDLGFNLVGAILACVAWPRLRPLFFARDEVPDSAGMCRPG